MKKQSSLKDCPICLHGRFLNKLSKDGFFCTNCLNEFKIINEQAYLVEIDEEKGDMFLSSIN